MRGLAASSAGKVLGGCLGFFSLSLLSVAFAAGSPVTVTITQTTPIETLGPGGTVLGVREAAVGEAYTLVSSQGDQLVLRDAGGKLYEVASSGTNYVAPRVAASPSAPAVTSSPISVATTPAKPSVSTPPAASSFSPSAPGGSAADATSDAVARINKLIGKPLFSTDSFWKEPGLLIADRLGLRLEDKTKWETAYRRYFYDTNDNYAPTPVLGGGAYCIALYADAKDAPTSALIAFTNDGDYQGVALLTGEIFRLRHPSGTPAADAEQKLEDLQARVDKVKQSFETHRANEAKVLTKNLTTLFGEPQHTSFGSDAATREEAARWDWNGVSFLLACEPNKYNLLRIIPSALADNHGRTERIPTDELSAKLTAAVEHRDNGDVVITQIPMADQGLKGYCVPATWERVLRYTAVPGDMYTLSRVSGGVFGGGENGGMVARKLDETLHDYDRRVEFINLDRIDGISLHHYIDEGIPVFWAVNTAGYEPAEVRYGLCDRSKDWDGWKKLLEQSRSLEKTHSRPSPLVNEGGHQVLITGYNRETKEIAWSDPWGRQTQERWMTEEEAERASLGQFYIITW